MVDNPRNIDATRRQLDAFLVANPDFETLSARLSSFNIFNVLKIAEWEIRHSNVLAWLLDPQETHGLGDRFLRRFLSRLLLDRDDFHVPFSAVDLELMPLENIEVLREERGIDVVVLCRGAVRWSLLIENKIRAGEAEGQLGRYRREVEELNPAAPVLPVYLTVDGDEPSADGKLAGFVPVSYGQVIDISGPIIEQNRSRIPPAAALLLDDWLTVLGRLTMKDQALIDLCRQIYRRHRDALELIVTYGKTSELSEACEAALSKAGELAFTSRNGANVWFLPRRMASTQRPLCTGWPFLEQAYPVMWWFECRRNAGRLSLILEVGPTKTPALRRQILEAAAKAGFASRPKGLREEAQYTRIYRKDRKLGPEAEREEIETAAEELWRGAAPHLEKIIEVLQGVKWN